MGARPEAVPGQATAGAHVRAHAHVALAPLRLRAGTPQAGPGGGLPPPDVLGALREAVAGAGTGTAATSPFPDASDASSSLTDVCGDSEGLGTWLGSTALCGAANNDDDDGATTGTAPPCTGGALVMGAAIIRGSAGDRASLPDESTGTRGLPPAPGDSSIAGRGRRAKQMQEPQCTGGCVASGSQRPCRISRRGGSGSKGVQAWQLGLVPRRGASGWV